MAENVQAILERMVPELECLESRGLLSREERGRVVARREADEYLLARRGGGAAKEADFARALAYNLTHRNQHFAIGAQPKFGCVKAQRI